VSGESRERVLEVRETVDRASRALDAGECILAGSMRVDALTMLADFVADGMTHGNLQAAQRMARQIRRLDKPPDDESMGYG
jgi:hypothetical protein